MTPIPDLSFEERVRLRRALDQLDQKEAGGPKVFDLNKPPTKPYVFQEYPFLMYRYEIAPGQLPKMVSRAAHDSAERSAMREAGWSEESGIAPPVPGIELTAEESAEAQIIDEQLKKKKK